jgi:predicted dehydrogenase
MTNLRWGIISTAEIGMAQVIPAIQGAEQCEVVAIASRDADRAAAAAARLGIPRAFGSYQELLDCDEVDAVYNPLPNDAHAEWTIRAARAGKHVLCEKPLAVSAGQADEMIRACADAGVTLAEAFMYRHHPSWVEAVRLVREGAIGELRAVQTWFSFYNDDPANIRNQVERGGGAVLDIGCYCINVARLLFGAEPVRVEAAVRRDPAMGIDILSSALLQFPGGGQSVFTCSTRAEPYQRVHVFGTSGRIEIEIPFNIPADREARIFLSSGGDGPAPSATEILVFGPADQYALQATAFARAVLAGEPMLAPAADAIGNMKVIDAILATG